MTEPVVRPAVLVLVRHEGKILLAQHRYHSTELPVLIAGMIEEGESAEEAAVREVAEETGLVVTLDGILGTYVFRDGERHLLMIACLATATSSELVLDDELVEASWHTLDELAAWPPEWPINQVFRDYTRLEATR